MCSAYIDELVRELDKGFLVTIDPEDATKTVKVPVDERTRDLLKLSLDKNKADYYDDDVVEYEASVVVVRERSSLAGARHEPENTKRK